MKHFRILLPLLVLALMLSACGNASRKETYTHSQSGYTFTVDPEKGTITHGEDVYEYQMEESGSRTSYVITYPNGATYHWTESKTGGAGGWSDDYDEERYIRGQILINALTPVQPREKTGNVFVGILLIALGGVNFFLPELGFYLRYGWAVENAEPSDAYITLNKIGGVLAALAGLVWCFI